MRDLEQVAVQSVARGVGFGTLAISLVVVGLAGYPTLALKSGAALTLLMWAILRLKALRAPRRPYKRTEVWLMLEPRPDWPAEIAQRLIGGGLAAHAGAFCPAGSGRGAGFVVREPRVATSGPALTQTRKGAARRPRPLFDKPFEVSLTGDGARRRGS